jgi:hypothetical protein
MLPGIKFLTSKNTSIYFRNKFFKLSTALSSLEAANYSFCLLVYKTKSNHKVPDLDYKAENIIILLQRLAQDVLFVTRCKPKS